MATERPIAGRPRAMSGTIPSMEVSHEQLKDNTIIIGEVIYSKQEMQMLIFSSIN